MRRPIGVLFLVAASLTLMAQTAAADSFVRCPVDEATTRIVDPVPRGWSARDGKARLSDTRVVRKRGRDTLECVYGKVGTLEIAAPRREDCRARKGGFQCKARRPGKDRPKIVSEGSLKVPAAVPVDLDRGQLTNGANGDLWVRARNPFQRYIEPLNGARLAMTDASDPGPRDCRNARYSDNQLRMFELLGSNWVCFVTDRGRVGRLRVTSMAMFPMTLDIVYTTWE